MITVHHLETSRSQRILWLLEELGVPYELKIYQRDKATKLAPPELKKIHPLGKSPNPARSSNTWSKPTGPRPAATWPTCSPRCARPSTASAASGCTTPRARS